MKHNITRYTSKGKRISKSRYHPDMWIIDLPDGKFYSINMSEQLMLKNNPPDLINDIQLSTHTGRPQCINPNNSAIPKSLNNN
jgi:hypothetical protein